MCKVMEEETERHSDGQTCCCPKAIYDLNISEVGQW